MSADHLALAAEIEFENDIKKDPFAVKYWWRYLQHKEGAKATERNQLYERALAQIPGSYKLWFHYLMERVEQVSDRPLDCPTWEAVNKTFARAIVFMNKMPRIWTEYISCLTRQKKATAARRAIDAALRALPVTQHDRVWKVAHEFLKQDMVPVETACRLWKRYLQLEPHAVEDFVAYLKKNQRWSDVANALVGILNDRKFVSTKGRTRHELWVELCTTLSERGDAVQLDDTSLTVEKVIRAGVRKYSSEVGQLWCALANYHTLCRNFDKARDLYEEGIATVSTVKDFRQIFEAYTDFEYTLVQVKEERLSGGDADEEYDHDDYTKAVLKATETTFGPKEEVEFALKRMMNLMERRPLLLNSVLLRQNKHNVHEWLKRVDLTKEKALIEKVYSSAVATVDPMQAKGKPHTLWINFAKWYEKQGKLPAARQVLSRAVQQNFKAVDDLATVWCSWAELELRAGKFKLALEVLKKATATNFTGQGSWKKIAGQKVQERVWRSVKLWSFYADLNEALCTQRSTMNVYDRMIYLKVITPQLILHYASYLKENGFWEHAFRAYQHGVDLFHWPLVSDIWVAYLQTFVTRFQGHKVERMRDLLESCVKDVPRKMAKRFYLMYAHFEERHGLAKQCMAVYDRACNAVPPEEKHEMYRKFLKATEKFFEKTRLREVYEKALAAVPEVHIPELALEYAELENSLGEVDRARALFQHAAQYVDPRKENALWPAWEAFENKRGNEDTIHALIRAQRSIKALYAAQTDLGAAAAAAREQRKKLEEQRGGAGAGGAAGGGKKVKVGPKREGDEALQFVEAAAAEEPKEAEKPEDKNVEEIEVEVPDALFEGFGSKRAAEDAAEAPDAKRARV